MDALRSMYSRPLVHYPMDGQPSVVVLDRCLPPRRIVMETTVPICDDCAADLLLDLLCLVHGHGFLTVDHGINQHPDATEAWAEFRPCCSVEEAAGVARLICLGAVASGRKDDARHA